MKSHRDKGEVARFYTVTDPKRHHKGYTVYKVTARIISRKNPEDVQEITVWKRYSDFRKLHQNLWQLHKNVCSQSELFPPFAKAKVFGRFDDSVIEERRQCSEDLLQFSANIPVLYSSRHVQDFFKGGDVHDGSELIGPAEPFSDFLADSWSDCSSDAQRDISGAEDLTVTSEYGASSDSDLTSLALDTDSLADLDDGMASGRTSPNQPHGGASTISCSPLLHERRLSPCPAASPSSSAPDPEVPRTGRAALFSSSLRRAVGGGAKGFVKSDYLDKAGELIRLAVQRESEQDYQAAFSFYRSGVDLLLQGVQGESSPKRREAVKKKTAEYLLRAEQISNQHLRSGMGQGSTQTVVMGAQCCPSASRGSQPSSSEELRGFRVLGVIDKVLLVMDKRTQETFVLKGLRKSSDCGTKRTIVPHSVPNMVQLKKFVVSEDAVFLLLQYAEGGKLWSHIGKYLRNSSPDESFDIPFIQKSHTAAVHVPQHAGPQPQPEPGTDSVSSGSEPVTGSDSFSGLQKDLDKLSVSPQRRGLTQKLLEQIRTQSDSGATSEEECTNSYLTLCNEYEQEKVEPDALEGGGGGGEEEEEKSERETLSLDVPMATTSASSRTRSLLSNDSLSSPISSQELGFFTESSDKSDPTHNDETYPGKGPEHSDVFSPLPSPAAPGSLNQSKHTPMELFRIDSKDSASEVTCLDFQVPLAPFSTSDLGSDLTDDLPELAQEVKGHSLEFWGLDSSDKGSNESVPVISFKEAAIEDEGQPPDLLVNLPVLSDTVDSLQEEFKPPGDLQGHKTAACLQTSIQPDVLQLHTQPGEEEEEEEPQQPSSFCPASDDSNPSSSSAFVSLWDTCSLTFGQEGVGKVVVDLPSQGNLLDTDTIETQELNVQDPKSSGNHGDRGQDEGEPSRAKADSGGRDFDKEVSRLFARLDELALAASQVPIPEEFVKRWAVEMVTALHSLHQEGIVCRDLNPNNILLDHQGHVQLTYFCSWSDVEESCDKDAVINMYCAPEVGGISEETAACDWWSLGAILFELLTGTSLLRCHPAGIGRHTTLSVPELLSEEARSLLEQLLQYNPTERLGAGVSGVDEIKSHPFFAGVEWPQ